MLYKLKLNIFKNHFLRNTYRKFFRKNEIRSGDIRRYYIGKYSMDKTFIDVGCMWGVNGFFTFLAEELGAKESTGFDIYPQSDEFRKMHAEKKSKVKFVQGDINSKKDLDDLGKFDVVYCTGLLYHVPDPIYTLNRLRQISNDLLIIGTAIIPEINGIQNCAVYYPLLDEKQRKIWDLKQGDQIAINSPYDYKQGYGNWLWGFSESCLESMIKTSGFDIIEKSVGKFYSYIVCRISKEEFMHVSGDWVVPEYRKNIESVISSK